MHYFNCNNSTNSDNNKVPLLCYEEFKVENRQDLERNKQKQVSPF